jgi:ring-1,2-phenylacetyl-CoA epoxidase subunit PaaE
MLSTLLQKTFLQRNKSGASDKAVSLEQTGAIDQIDSSAQTCASVEHAKTPSLQFHRLKVAEVSALTEDSVMLTFDIPDQLKPDFQFTPGQYLTLRTRIEGQLVSRCYSICSPIDDARLSIAIRKVSSGRFSRFAVDQLAANDELEVMPPMGRFQLVPQTPNAEQTPCYVGVAGGSGITPIMSMIKSLLTSNSQAKFVLFYANRSPSSMMFKEVLEHLETQYPDRFFMLPFYSQPTDQQETTAASQHAREQAIHLAIADGLKGKTSALPNAEEVELSSEIQLLLNDLPDLNRADHWYLCGPQGMTDTVHSVLIDNDVEATKIQRELFTAAQTSLVDKPHNVDSSDSSTKEQQISIIHEGKSIDFTWDDSHQVILNQALTQQDDLPHACQFGACGTCKAKVVEGEVTLLENMALETDDLAKGYILTCQAIPCSDKVVISYDE